MTIYDMNEFIQRRIVMQILKNISKSELNYLTSQPTAKAMIEKNRECAINIPKGDEKKAKEFVEMRKEEKNRDTLEISDTGLSVMKKTLEIISK